MSYLFTSEPKDGYLHIRIKGENTPATIHRYLGDVLHACVTNHCPNVLIEEDLSGERLRLGDVFSIIEENSGNFRSALRLAAYVDLRATNPANMQFAETVAVNRGVTLSVFAAVADAENWLRQKLASPPSG
jgi:hypothetical protein